MSDTQDTSPEANLFVPPLPPPQRPSLKRLRESLKPLADPIDGQLDRLASQLVSPDDVAKDILQLQRRVLWQAADLWSLLANERSAIGDAKGADESRREAKTLMHHWSEESSSDAPSDAVERLDRLVATTSRPLDVERVILPFGDASAGEHDENVREMLRQYGRAFGEHARPVIEKIAEASIRATAGDLLVAAQLLQEAHVLMDAVSTDAAYPVADLWCDLAYACRSRDDLRRTAEFADRAYLLLPTKHFRLHADEAICEFKAAEDLRMQNRSRD